jgi:hypothetical protein
VALVGGYVLGSYESINDEGYFVARGSKVVISSTVKEITVVGDKVIGRVEDAMVSALERIQNGYFILNTSTGDVEAGLSEAELMKRLSINTFPRLVKARDWRP